MWRRSAAVARIVHHQKLATQHWRVTLWSSIHCTDRTLRPLKVETLTQLHRSLRTPCSSRCCLQSTVSINCSVYIFAWYRTGNVSSAQLLMSSVWRTLDMSVHQRILKEVVLAYIRWHKNGPFNFIGSCLCDWPKTAHFQCAVSMRPFDMK